MKKLPYNPKLKQRAKELRKAGNLSEVLLWNRLKRKQFLDLDFDRQKIIGNYIVDFYCPTLGIIIEVDGSSHDDKIEYDEIRDEYLKGLGLSVIHILDRDIKNNLEGAVQWLESGLLKLPRQSATATPSTLEGELP
jgi:very-short-patch-repair endonuclease